MALNKTGMIEKLKMDKETSAKFVEIIIGNILWI